MSIRGLRRNRKSAIESGEIMYTGNKTRSRPGMTFAETNIGRPKYNLASN